MKVLTIEQANTVNRMLQASLDVSRGLQVAATSELENLREWLENELPAPQGAYQTYEERLGLLKYWMADLESIVRLLKHKSPPMEAGTCTLCGAVVARREGRAGEFDHICGTKDFYPGTRYPGDPD